MCLCSASSVSPSPNCEWSFFCRRYEDPSPSRCHNRRPDHLISAGLLLLLLHFYLVMRLEISRRTEKKWENYRYILKITYYRRKIQGNSLFTFLEQNQFSSVDANMCERVPNLWNNMAENCITKIKAKKNTNTKPMGSSCRYSFDINTWKCEICFRLALLL